jgi:alkanesulfonate monooxygenase SsuD/methylene tetrahydromethanopterin reductase-like flavin-dependent oxidoreductase (luciferase family)
LRDRRGRRFDVWLAKRRFASPERAAPVGLHSVASAPLILASALAGRTPRIPIGTAVGLLPLAHSVWLAEEVATHDLLSGGRLDFGIGRSGFLTAYHVGSILRNGYSRGSCLGGFPLDVDLVQESYLSRVETL